MCVSVSVSESVCDWLRRWTGARLPSRSRVSNRASGAPGRSQPGHRDGHSHRQRPPQAGCLADSILARGFRDIKSPFVSSTCWMEVLIPGTCSLHVTTAGPWLDLSKNHRLLPIDYVYMAEKSPKIQNEVRCAVGHGGNQFWYLCAATWKM